MKPTLAVIAIALCAALLGSVSARGLGERWMSVRSAPVTLQIAGLDASQQQSLRELQQRQAAFRITAHAEIGQLIESAQHDLADPHADLRAMSQQTTRTLVALAAEMNALREGRLAFYESLDAEQQHAAREFLQLRLARLQRFHALVGDFLADAQ